MARSLKRVYIGEQQYIKIKRFCERRSIKMIDFINMVIDSVIDDSGEMRRDTVMLDRDVVDQIVELSIRMGRTPSDVIRLMIDTINVLFSDRLPLYKALRPLSELKRIVYGDRGG